MISNNKKIRKISSIKITIKGLVQGVGFRPFIYKTAIKHNIKGWVINTSSSVEIRAEGTEININNFIFVVRNNAPKNSKIKSMQTTRLKIKNFSNFEILKSKIVIEKITEISPDIAVCGECLDDIKIQKNRINYPFVNCINCGPRFSIIKDVPYDRENTTMDNFIMCKSCKSEYLNADNRRFHAQPIACLNCGPIYKLIKNNKIIINIHEILQKSTQMLDSGKILAVKGIGGYNLVCDALNKKSINKLRKIKKRDKKPFAVMFSDIDNLKKYIIVNKKEEEILLSAKRPIVLLKSKNKINRYISGVLDTVGVMLPYMPFHYLLFDKLKTKVLIYTSGNISDEPIIIDNDNAVKIFKNLTHGILEYNREIYNRLDDSVAVVVNDKKRLIRRSRGYVPESINVKIDVNGIIASGGELKNTFCVGKDNFAYLSQHIGDLKNLETYQFYTESINKFKNLLKVKPSLFVCDMHPEYLSTKYAKGSNNKIIQIQHHHAHIASCMAENNIDEDVIGVALDGNGYGADGKIWGGEFFVCNLIDYQRINYFDYVPMPGGDRAIDEPWRMAVSYLYKIYNKDFKHLNIPFLKKIDKNKVKLIIHAIDNNINCPLTSSAGRLFDSISAILNLCLYSSYEAEAPMKLESIIKDNVNDYYKCEIKDTILTDDIIKGVILDIHKKTSKEIISAKFHNSIINIIIETALKIKKQFNLNKVVLSGGIFQNKYILSGSEKGLIKNNFNVYSQMMIPSNDGGISLGQLVIAGKRRENNVS